MSAQIVELILTDDLVGKGTEDSPMRRLQQLYTKDGRLVAQYDPCESDPNIKQTYSLVRSIS